MSDMGTRAAKAKNPSASIETTDPEEWNIRLGFGRKWSKFKDQIGEAYQSHIASDAHADLPWRDVPIEHRGAARSEVLALWRGTDVDKYAQLTELQSCIMQCLQHYHESQQAVARSGIRSESSTAVATASPDDAEADATEIEPTGAADDSVSRAVDESDDTSEARPPGRNNHRDDARRGSRPRQAVSKASRQRRRATAASIAGSTPHDRSRSASKDTTGAEDEQSDEPKQASLAPGDGQQDLEADIASGQTEQTNQAPSQPPSRRPWYELEIERLRTENSRLVEERAEIHKAFEEEKDKFELKIEDQKRKIEEFDQGMRSMKSAYMELKRVADDVFDPPRKKQRS